MIRVFDEWLERTNKYVPEAMAASSQDRPPFRRALAGTFEPRSKFEPVALPPTPTIPA